MNDQSTDFELLQDFARRVDQAAFTALVRRHLDLVYATALRKAGEESGAQEIAQNVFAALARKAWRFGPDDSLPAWLYKATLLEAREWLRGEFRRRRREQTAAELGTTMKTPDEQPALRALVPLLDEALLSLREKDRAALLLRFYERRSLREVGASLGVGEDAAQKRVAGAVEHLARFFQRRGFKAATLGTTTAVLQNTAASASASATATVIQGVLVSAPPAVAGLTALLVRFTALSQAQVATLCVALVALPVGWQWNERRMAEQEAARLQTELETIRRDQTHIETEIQQLTEGSDRVNASLARAMERETERGDAARTLELWKTRLRRELMAKDYRWPEDLPFVRIPKSAIVRIGMSTPIIQPPGVLKPEACELLGLTSSERMAVAEQLQKHFRNLEQIMDNSVYATNQWAGVSIPDAAVASRIFILPPLGPAARESSNEMLGAIQSLLGEERWPLLDLQLTLNTPAYRQALGLEVDHTTQYVAVWVSGTGPRRPTAGYRWRTRERSLVIDGVSLVPEGPDASGKQTYITGELERTSLPSVLVDRILAWFREQAALRADKEPEL